MSGFATKSIHAGDPARALGASVSNSIVTSVNFYANADAVSFSAPDMNESAPLFYARWGNPTVNLLEQRLAELERGAAAVAFGSGMAAISAVFLGCLRSGDHLVISDVCYAGAAELAGHILPRYGIDVTFVDTSQVDAVERAIRPGKTKLVHIETPANPLLRLSDIRAIADVCHSARVRLSVDSTIATPVATKPIELGADFVIHSLTKYMCGHGDAQGGAVIARDPEAAADLRQHSLIHHGGVLSPFSAWLILRGIETLSARMHFHEHNARAVASFLSEESSVGVVHWPGLDAHPQAELAKRQMANFSGLLSFTVKRDATKAARRFSDKLRVVSYAVSLGITKSVLFYISTDEMLRTSFDKMDAKGVERYRAAAGEGLFRLSVGLENPDDLISDLEQALA